MKSYTITEKKAYIQELRNKWNGIKKAVDDKKLTELQAIIAEHGLTVSPYSYYFTSLAMQENGYDGIPYLDCKTFQGWQERGFKVRKGEHSKIHGITWILAGQKKTNDDTEVEEKIDNGYRYPKAYALFHKSQVDSIN